MECEEAENSLWRGMEQHWHIRSFHSALQFLNTSIPASTVAKAAHLTVRGYWLTRTRHETRRVVLLLPNLVVESVHSEYLHQQLKTHSVFRTPPFPNTSITGQSGSAKSNTSFKTSLQHSHLNCYFHTTASIGMLKRILDHCLHGGFHNSKISSDEMKFKKNIIILLL